MNIYSFSEISRSNETCSIYEPLIFIPNAFTPGGINPIFKPIVSLINPTAYELSILSRWGDVIFETKDMNEGWDGTITLSDQKAETGLYMYVLRVKNGDGEEITKRGHVSLLR
jgi:gliding motility-associated-like protein